MVRFFKFGMSTLNEIVNVGMLLEEMSKYVTFGRQTLPISWVQSS